MSIVDWLNNTLGWFVGFRMLLLPVALTALCYVVLRQKDVLSLHARQNIAATMVLVGMNIVLSALFIDDIYHFTQFCYDALGIPTLAPDTWKGLPLWAQIILALVARDFADYLLHRAMHTTWLWPTHAAHHSDTKVSAFTTYRVHFLETVLMTMNYILLLTWLQLPDAIPFVAVLTTLHNMYVHLDLDIDHGPFKFLLASPVYHRWHHADVPEAYGKNLANLIPAFDLIFGTYYENGRCREQMGALSSVIEDKDPIKIFTYPFRKWAQLWRKARARRSWASPKPTIPAE